MRDFLIFILIFFTLKSNGQLRYEENNFGVQAGVSLSVGTHVNQLGFFAKTYTILPENFQWNNEFRINFYLRNLGPKKPHAEIQLSSSLLFGYGDKELNKKLFFNKTSNFTGCRNSIAYTYNIYLNTIRTSQQTGSVTLSFDNFYLMHENDLLARPTLDRFRTAGIQFGYEYENYRICVSQFNWTGMLGKSIKDSFYKSPAGYLDTTGNRYGLLSHGILSVSVEYSETKYFQQIKIASGIDAEQIRNFVQNRVVHDGCLFPASWRNKNNFHFPMISSDGNQYLFRENQKIKKASLFLNSYLNSDLIY
jgi:hypothetical protein